MARHHHTPVNDSEGQRRRDANRARLELAARELLTSEGWARWREPAPHFTFTPSTTRC